MITPEEARAHGLLCADGRLEKFRTRKLPRKDHRETASSKVGWNYRVRFWNINEVLMTNFVTLCERIFRKRVVVLEKDYETRIYSKDVYQYLLAIGPTGSHTWIMPIDKLDDFSLRAWLQGFFDGDGAVIYYEYRREVRIKSVNRDGLFQIKRGLLKLGIQSRISGPFRDKKSSIFYLTIAGKENLIRFRQLVNFVHPEKQEKLEIALASYKK